MSKEAPIKKKNSIDMLNGPIPSRVILFAIPLALTSIFQQLFNTADSVVAGRFIDNAALAAVGGVVAVAAGAVGVVLVLAAACQRQHQQRRHQ